MMGKSSEMSMVWVGLRICARGQPSLPAQRSEQRRGSAAGRQRNAQVAPCRGGGDPPAWCSRQHPGAHEVGLADLLDGTGFLADRDGECGDADRSPAEGAHERAENRAVEAVETQLVDVVDLAGRPAPRRG